jgi:hypothetical protein
MSHSGGTGHLTVLLVWTAAGLALLLVAELRRRGAATAKAAAAAQRRLTRSPGDRGAWSGNVLYRDASGPRPRQLGCRRDWHQQYSADRNVG